MRASPPPRFCYRLSLLLFLLEPYVLAWAQALTLSCAAIHAVTRRKNMFFPPIRVLQAANIWEHAYRFSARSTRQRVKKQFHRLSPLPFCFVSRVSPTAPFRCRAPSPRRRQGRRSHTGSPRYLFHGVGLVDGRGCRSFRVSGRVCSGGCC